MLKKKFPQVSYGANTFFVNSSKKYSYLTTLLSNPIQQSPNENLENFYLSTISFDSVTYTDLIKSSTKSGFSILGKLVHTHLIKTSFNSSLYLLNNLLNFYFKCGEIDYAERLFDRIPKRDVVSWNLLISGYCQRGFYGKAMEVFDKARTDIIKLDKFTYSSALNVCTQTKDVGLGELVHGLIIVSGLSFESFLINSLIDMYSKCGKVGQARLLFDTSDNVDDVSWNSLIAGYVRTGLNEQTLGVLVQMHRSGLKLNSFALGSVLKACSTCFDGSENFGKVIHGCTVKLGLDLDVVLCTALLDLYAKMGDLHNAIKIFKLMPDPNVVMFNAMIAGFFRSETEICEEIADEALHLFSEMQRKGIKPTKFTFSTIIKACNALEALEYGKQIHAQILKNSLQSDEFIGSTLVDLYSLSGSTEDALRCFHSTPKLDIVSWTSLIAGSVQNGQSEQALSLFSELLVSKIKPDESTISCALSACANLAAARSGEQIQCYAVKAGHGHSVVVCNSQICMYAKSGDIDAANLTFKETENRSVVSWSVMISSHAQHGCASEALSIFKEMNGCGVVPNHVTFLGVLTACSHGGLVEEGLRYFESMKKDHGLNPNAKHCACVVDLLGRAGRLADAEKFIMDSGFENDSVIWRALLGACRVHRDTVTGERVAKRVIELEPQDAASYVLLYNIYSEAGIEQPATEIRDLMKERGVKKEPGLSWIQIGETVHSFVVGDSSHPKSAMIYKKLEEMLEKIKKSGYVNEKSVSSASQQEQKGRFSVNYHSEKLALALGMISLPKSAPIRIMKNLRVCEDCHTTMKFFSQVEGREIILRDPIRFHRFRDGSCSCRDYW
ncbi:hypothetical protein AQUCO_01400070v1 [Aquilegia coerulea]|uniref:DYW domain-containing protein n=1 Tax=Aquilegia coerulea TaxID=218851 RepID=A0A2G5DUC4_AQUCA|nr:hypothetical protein AQUCO_01400070v1 [Aquilegia coerulea]